MLLFLETGPLKRQLNENEAIRVAPSPTGLESLRGKWDSLMKTQTSTHRGRACEDPMRRWSSTRTEPLRDPPPILWSWTSGLRNCENKLAKEAFGLWHFVMAALTGSCWGAGSQATCPPLNQTWKGFVKIENNATFSPSELGGIYVSHLIHYCSVNMKGEPF